MNWLRNFFSNLFSRKNKTWDTASYGKPSTEGDDFRKINEV